MTSPDIPPRPSTMLVVVGVLLFFLFCWLGSRQGWR